MSIPKTKKVYLIYNSQCDFCKNTARHFNYKLRGRLDILSNRTKKAKSLVPKAVVKNLKKDIHLVVSKKEIYARGEACFYLVKMRNHWLELFEPVAIPLFKLGYIVLKKIKKYL